MGEDHASRISLGEEKLERVSRALMVLEEDRGRGEVPWCPASILAALGLWVSQSCLLPAVQRPLAPAARYSTPCRLGLHVGWAGGGFPARCGDMASGQCRGAEASGLLAWSVHVRGWGSR